MGQRAKEADTAGDAAPVRVVELCGMLSLASDLAVGAPLEQGIRSATLAAHLARALGQSPDDQATALYLALMRLTGCTSTPELNVAVGNEVDLGRAGFDAGVDWGDPRALFVWMVRDYQAGMSLRERARSLRRAMAVTPTALDAGRLGHCEVAQRLATRLTLGGDVVAALGAAYERWDGRGPRHLKGTDVPEPMRIVDVAIHAATHHRIGGAAAVLATLGERRGRTVDPEVADAVTPEVLAVLDEPSAWQALRDAEPGPHRLAADEALDVAVEVVADFADQKAGCFTGHSRRVAELACAAAASSGVDADDQVVLRRAALVHDLGATGIATEVWLRPGPLSDLEWDEVRLHAYDTERIVGRVEALRGAAELAGRHHERCDGGGYHRGLGRADVPVLARILAAADVVDALRSERPHRPALPDREVARTAERLAATGSLDGEAVGAVLAAAQLGGRRRRSLWPDGLTDREVDVLRLAARGLSIRQVAAELDVRPKTVDTYLQRIYAKIGVSTRAAATVYAMEQGLT